MAVYLHSVEVIPLTLASLSNAIIWYAPNICASFAWKSVSPVVHFITRQNENNRKLLNAMGMKI